MRISDICSHDVVTISKAGAVREAAELMRANHVGDVVVVEERDGARIPIGILTDRDIVVELVAKGVDLDAVSVGDAMSFELLTATLNDDILETVQRMSSHGVRRAPVVNEDGELAGLISVDDLVGNAVRYVGDIYRLLLRERRQEAQYRD